ncbi:MAG: DUF3261 domain-containing protein [Burkholderiaceae bacterium]
MFINVMRRVVAIGYCASLMLGLSACSTLTREPQPAQQSMQLGLKLSPAALGASISLQQHLTVERDGKVEELDTAFEVDDQQLELVGLALGKRVMTLHYDGKTLQSWRHPMLPEQVRADDVLQDIQLTLWPADVIQQALPAGWRIEEKGLRRTLLSGETPVMVIDYSNPSRWNGKVVLSNLRYSYRITIQSVSTAP